MNPHSPHAYHISFRNRFSTVATPETGVRGNVASSSGSSSQNNNNNNNSSSSSSHSSSAKGSGGGGDRIVAASLPSSSSSSSEKVYEIKDILDQIRLWGTSSMTDDQIMRAYDAKELRSIRSCRSPSEFLSKFSAKHITSSRLQPFLLCFLATAAKSLLEIFLRDVTIHLPNAILFRRENGHVEKVNLWDVLMSKDIVRWRPESLRKIPLTRAIVQLVCAPVTAISLDFDVSDNPSSIRPLQAVSNSDSLQPSTTKMLYSLSTAPLTNRSLPVCPSNKDASIQSRNGGAIRTFPGLPLSSPLGSTYCLNSVPTQSSPSPADRISAAGSLKSKMQAVPNSSSSLNLVIEKWKSSKCLSHRMNPCFILDTIFFVLPVVKRGPSDSGVVPKEVIEKFRGSRSDNTAITSCSCSTSSSSSSVASSSSSSPSPLNRTPNYRFISFFATESDIVPWCTLENRIEVKIGFSVQSGGPGSASHLVNPPISSKRKSSKSKFQTVTPMDITDLVSRGPCSEISSIESNRLLQFFLKFKDSRTESAMSKPVMYFLLALADYYSPVEIVEHRIVPRSMKSSSQRKRAHDQENESEKKRKLSNSTILSSVDDDDIQCNRVVVSFKCPLSFSSIRYPGRGDNCKHLQCFDLESYISFCSESGDWNCPVCQSRVYCRELRLDPQMQSVIRDAPNGASSAEFEDKIFVKYLDERSRIEAQQVSVENVKTSSPSLCVVDLDDQTFASPEEGFPYPFIEESSLEVRSTTANSPSQFGYSQFRLFANVSSSPVHQPTVASRSRLDEVSSITHSNSVGSMAVGRSELAPGSVPPPSPLGTRACPFEID